MPSRLEHWRQSLQHDNPIEGILGRLDDPAFRDPQRNDPDARLSRATARAILKSLYYLDFAKRKGYYVHDHIDMHEVKRAKAIMTKIIISTDTEETL